MNVRKTLLIYFILILSSSNIFAQGVNKEIRKSYCVYFEWNKWEIIAESQKTELAKVIEELERHYGAKVVIVGWSDRSGTEDANKGVSLNRAKNVRNYLVERGISEERITFKSQGVDRQTSDNVKARRADIELTFYENNSSEVVNNYDVKDDEPNNKQSAIEQFNTPKQEHAALSPWSIGVNLGIPFLWGDMVSFSTDKAYIGFDIGLQGSYRISQLLGVSLSIDWANGKIGARDYAKNYLLSSDGMTHYTPDSELKPYMELYSNISVLNLGASLDVNLNRIFFSNINEHRFTALFSPTIYAQFFNQDVYLRIDDKKFTDGSNKSDIVSLAMGGSLSLRYKILNNIELQFKNSLVWITDNKFDAIVTPYGKSKHNAMWTSQVGVVWNIN